MTNEIKEIREYISCPQFGDDHYGKFGALSLDQRKKIKDLLDYITNLQNEIFDLKDTIQNKNDCIGAYECIIEDRDKRIDKAVEYLEQPYRDNFDYSKAELLNILRGYE